MTWWNKLTSFHLRIKYDLAWDDLACDLINLTGLFRLHPATNTATTITIIYHQQQLFLQSFARVRLKIILNQNKMLLMGTFLRFFSLWKIKMDPSHVWWRVRKGLLNHFKQLILLMTKSDQKLTKRIYSLGWKLFHVLNFYKIWFI